MPFRTYTNPATSPAMLDVDVFRAKLEEPGLIALLEHWLAKLAHGRLPNRRDIDPLAIRAILPDVYILEAEQERLRFRLAGSGLRTIFGQEATGCTLEDLLWGPDLENARRCYGTAAKLARPWLTRNVFDLGQGDRFSYARLVCPLASDGTHVDGFLGAFAQRDSYDPPRDFHDLHQRIQAVLERQEWMLDWSNAGKTARGS